MTDLSAANPLGELGALPEAATSRPLVLLDERPNAPSAVFTCTEQLPRDVVVRLKAVSRQVGALRLEHAADAGLSVRLDAVAANLDGLIQSVYDETARHVAGRAT